MFVKSLRLFNFRNNEDSSLSFSEGLNIFFGNNGQGKTNIVEALGLLSATKSFRTSKTKELIKWGREEASAFAVVQDSIGENELGVTIQRNQKSFFVNGNQVQAVDFVGKLVAITFSPSDIEMIKGGPSERRRFMDRHLIDVYPNLLSNYMRYNRALKNKQSLLKMERIEGKQLDMWDSIMAENLAPILSARDTFLVDLGEELLDCYSRFAQDDGEVSIEIDSSIPENFRTKEKIRDFIVENRNSEISQRSSLIGVHRDDLKISLRERSSRLYASQGQSKSLAIALKLSVLSLLEKKHLERPVVILDDVDSELDSTRCSKLYEFVMNKERQVFITGTDINRAVKDGGKAGYNAEIIQYFVESGRVDKR